MSASYSHIMALIHDQISTCLNGSNIDPKRIENLCSQIYMIEVDPALSSQAKKKQMKEKMDHFSSLL